MIAERVANVLRIVEERGEILTTGAIYNVARDLISERCGSMFGTYYGTNTPAPTVMRVELRDGASPGEALLYVVDGEGKRLMHFGVMTSRDFEAKEVLTETLQAFAEQSARVAA